MSLSNVRARKGPVAAPPDAVDAACCGEGGAGAVSVAPVPRPRPIQRAVFFGPLLRSEARRGHDRYRVTQDAARLELQPLVWGRGIAEPNDVRK
jgi:hypothetical protein